MDGHLQRDGVRHRVHQVAHLVGGKSCAFCDFLNGGFAPQFLLQDGACLAHLVKRPGQVDGHADERCLLLQRAGDGAANPPAGVGTEAPAPVGVKQLRRTQQPQIALLNQVREGQPAPHIVLGDGKHQPQVGLNQLLACLFVALPRPTRQLHLFFRSQQGIARRRGRPPVNRVLQHLLV